MSTKTNSRISPRFYQLSLTALVLLGIFLRFYDLDVRPVHHDESLHGTYARYAVENPEESFYHYNPMLHGPLLYQCVTWLFSTFGVSTFVLRSLNAGLGSLFLLTPLLFRRFLSPSAVIWSTAALALSPGLIYWSRFAHHDYLVLASYTLLAAGVFLNQARTGIILCFISFALQYAIKANIFVFAALLFGYLVFDFLCLSYFKRSDKISYANKDTLFLKIGKAISANGVATAIGAILSATIFSALYSGNFRDSTGILDGLYRKVFAYWIEQHHMQRLDGPFSFHLLVLSLYELPLLIAFIAAVVLTIRQLKRKSQIIISVLSGLLLVVPYLLPENLYNGGVLSSFVKVKSPFDLFVSLELAILSIVLPTHFLKNKQRALSFFAYLALATLWTYSFLGEKVPWLTTYPQVTALIFIALFFDSQKIFEGKILSLLNPQSVTRVLLTLSSLAIIIITLCMVEGLLKSDPDAVSKNTLRLLGWSFGCLVSMMVLRSINIDQKIPAITFGLFVAVSFYTSILTNYTLAGDKRELLSQVHTNEESHRLFLSLREHLLNPLRKTEGKILVTGSATWPATWYLRGLPGLSFAAEKSNYSTFDYLVVDETDDGVDANFDTRLVPLQSWWVPDYSKLRLKTLLIYFFEHEPWNTPGSLQVKFAVPIANIEEEEDIQSDNDQEESFTEGEAEDPTESTE